MSVLSTNADAAATASESVKKRARRRTRQVRTGELTRDLAIALGIALLIVGGLLLLLHIPASSPGVNPPLLRPRPSQLDLPYRPPAPGQRKR